MTGAGEAEIIRLPWVRRRIIHVSSVSGFGRGGLADRAVDRDPQRLELHREHGPGVGHGIEDAAVVGLGLAASATRQNLVAAVIALAVGALLYALRRRPSSGSKL